jgi:hypothetical protein
MFYLKEASSVSPLWALTGHPGLVVGAGYVNGNGIVKGISAMPSMHVATCILFIPAGLFSSGKILVGWHLPPTIATLIFPGLPSICLALRN